MSPAPSNIHSVWARLFVHALARSGVTHFVLSPGSRSTPLALAAESEPGLELMVVVDERSAAFVALGQARTTGRPTVILGTSGTAGAHWLPAIVEAAESRLPLIAVTADRPWDLQHTAASQTTDQRKMFGDFARLSLELGLPDPRALGAVMRIGAHAVLASLHPVPGPVHVDAPFRKPLAPVATDREPWEDEAAQLLERGPAKVRIPKLGVPSDAASSLVGRIARSKRCALVAGPASQASIAGAADRERFTRAVARFAKAAGFAVFAEATSGARFGSALAEHVVPCFDAVLRSRALGDALPDLIVEIGSPPCSSAYEQLVAATRPTRVVISEHGLPDPHASAEEIVVASTTAALELVAEMLEREPAPGADDRRRWADEAAALGRRADAMAEGLAGEWSEAAVARTTLAALPKGAILVVGNSLPIRDLDRFGGGRSETLVVQHQRGVAGIDGLIAGAVGARTTTPPETPVALVLGDVSALHDVGSFALLASIRAPLAIIVVDNGGGRIFEELPLAETLPNRATFERLFLTPQPKFLAGVASGFGVPHRVVDSIGGLEGALRGALEAASATVIECAVPPNDGKARRAKLLSRVETLRLRGAAT